MTIQDTFEQVRQLYPGTTRGLPTELDNFKRHKDWRDVLPLLAPAIEAQIKWRKTAKNGEFREAWKHFRTWINQRWWEMEVKVEVKEKCKCVNCGTEKNVNICHINKWVCTKQECKNAIRGY